MTSAERDYFDPRDPPEPEPCDECDGTRWPTEDHEEHCSLADINGTVPMAEEPPELEDYMMGLLP